MNQVGFEMVDRIARDERIPLNTIQSKALLGIGKKLKSSSIYFLSD